MALITASTTQAQTVCTLPSNVALPRAERWYPGDAVRVPVTGYVLALSWSPEFCRTRRSDPSQTLQCGVNNFGFVVHGLWPEGAGRDPERCAPASPPDAATLRRHLCMMPGAALIQHEWARHGSCGWPSASAYLDATAALWRRLRLPDVDRLNPNIVTAGPIRSAFIAANPALPRGAIFIDLNNRRWLREVRICTDRALRFAPCQDGRTGAPDAVSLRVWRR